MLTCKFSQPLLQKQRGMLLHINVKRLSATQLGISAHVLTLGNGDLSFKFFSVEPNLGFLTAFVIQTT